MVRISYQSQLALPGHSLRYSWQGRSLVAQMLQHGQIVAEETYDLSMLQPGDEVERIEPDSLSFSPLLSARCTADGTLEVALLYWYEGDEPEFSEEVRDG